MEPQQRCVRMSKIMHIVAFCVWVGVGVGVCLLNQAHSRILCLGG